MGEASSLGPTPQAGLPPADRVALTGEVGGFPRLNQRPTGVVTAIKSPATPVEMVEESRKTSKQSVVMPR